MSNWSLPFNVEERQFIKQNGTACFRDRRLGKWITLAILHLRSSTVPLGCLQFISNFVSWCPEGYASQAPNLLRVRAQAVWTTAILQVQNLGQKCFGSCLGWPLSTFVLVFFVKPAYPNYWKECIQVTCAEEFPRPLPKQTAKWVRGHFFYEQEDVCCSSAELQFL